MPDIIIRRQPPHISLFTPVHKPRYLAETWRSLRNQTFIDWEWVIMPNGNCRLEDLPKSALTDPRVRVVSAPLGHGGRVGALKRAACEACRGNVLVELDHDDLLTVDAVAAVAGAHRLGGSFIYSDDALFELDGTSWGYSETHGWTTYPVTCYGKRLKATATFPINARVLSEVHYSPDHLRAWTREAYFTAGGHDPELEVGDDHELMVRTYLAGFQFRHTGGCHYLYRRHDDNTVSEKSGTIASIQAKTRNTNIRPLINEWIRRTGLPVLQLSTLYKEGKWSPADPLQLFDKGNHYGWIVANSVLPEIQPDMQEQFMRAAWEALVPGGWLSLAVPHERSNAAAANPISLVKFNEYSMLRYTGQIVGAERPLFDQAACYTIEQNDTEKKYDMRYLSFELCALKGQRHPGVPCVAAGV